jgi:hypothetical protein
MTTRKHDGKPVPPELWGKDHLTTLLYVETVCTDRGGIAEAARMRQWSGRVLRGDVSHARPCFSDKDYPTRLRNGDELTEHDDWDCVEDMVQAGLILWGGTGILPVLKLTDKGWALAGVLRRYIAEGGSSVSGFSVERLQEAIKDA